MAAYLVADVDIADAEAYDRYRALVRPTVESFGGEFLARGGALDVIESDLWTPSRLVIIRFPDAAAARAWADSPEYAPVRSIRRGAARATLAVVDGA
jgi:uncharacterized protein (DUF1330 family)